MADLTRADIEEIMHLIDGSDFDELTLEIGDLKLELRRRGARPGGDPGAATGQSARGGPNADRAAESQPGPDPAAYADKPAVTTSAPVVASGGGSEVPAPLLGTFYHAAKPGADPFVRIGDTVSADTVIGIIEVMKLMNQVTAGVAGTVTEICAGNGQLVEHGQALIRVQPA